MLAESGHAVTLWAHRPEVARDIASKGENTTYLPGFPLPVTLRATADLAEAVRDKDVVLSVSPSHVVRTVMTEAVDHLTGDPYVVTASKGIEETSLLTMAGVLEEIVGTAR